MLKGLKNKLPLSLCCILTIILFAMPATSLAKHQPKLPNWCFVEPEEEVPSPYYDSILYSHIAPRLCEIKRTSDRVKVEVIGQSAGGRDLYLATVTGPLNKKKFCLKDKLRQKMMRRLMIKDPDKALALIENYDDFNVPVFINCSIHGNEYPGTDACMRMIETLAYDDSEEVQAILDNTILLFNVVANPDGRVLGTRRNANDLDLNRDMITQSQPETRAAVSVITEWNPMVFLDLHDDVQPMLIEPCTPPHNPNYEYDLYLAWAWELALAMEDELLQQKALGDLYYPYDTALIPYRDWSAGWDDWPPIYAAMYPIYHGSYGHTIETWSEEIHGVDADYAVVWGALKFIVDNKKEMVADQIEVYRRGALDLPQRLIPDYLLDQTQWEQYNELTIQEFPAAYVIPAGPPYQLSKHQAARLVDFLLFNDVQVEKAQRRFWMDGVKYPRGTYVVWMNQPKRGMANTILDAGLDLSDIEGLEFYSAPSAWSHPYLWGASRAVMEEPIHIKTRKVKKVKSVKGSVERGKARAIAFLPTSLEAFQATNDLLAHGVTLYRAEEAFEDCGKTIGAGAIIVKAGKWKAHWLAIKYGLDVLTLKELPDDLTRLQTRRIAIYGEGGLRTCLDRLGFAYDLLSRADLDAGLIAGYDLFINDGLRWASLSEAGQAAMSAWFEAGGDYIGLSYLGRAIQFAIDAGIADVSYEYVSGDGIVNVDYDPTDSVAAGFREDGYAFVYYPVWFSNLGSEVKVSASIDPGNDFLVAGYWPGWQDSDIKGEPIIVHQTTDTRDVTLLGIDATFRGHPENTFRIVGNAIYDGLEN